MTFQHLDNFAGLKIPNVSLVVFTASYDPLAAGDAEAGRYTIFRVDMASIGLEAASAMIIPQTNSAVVRG